MQNDDNINRIEHLEKCLNNLTEENIKLRSYIDDLEKYFRDLANENK
jgi:hypothetical protein